MSVTLPTFHAEISVLKEVFPLNKFDMSVTAETSHVPMAGEHAPIGEAARQVFTAANRAALVVNTCDNGGGGGWNGGGWNGGGWNGGGWNGGRGGGRGGEGGEGGDGGGGGGSEVHTEPPADPTNAVVSSAVFESQPAEHRTRLNEFAA